MESKNSSTNGVSPNVSRPDPSQAIGDGFVNIPEGLDEGLPFN